MTDWCAVLLSRNGILSVPMGTHVWIIETERFESALFILRRSGHNRRDEVTQVAICPSVASKEAGRPHLRRNSWQQAGLVIPEITRASTPFSQKLTPTISKSRWMGFFAWLITVISQLRTWCRWPCSLTTSRCAGILYLDPLFHGRRPGIVHPLHQNFSGWPHCAGKLGNSTRSCSRVAGFDG